MNSDCERPFMPPQSRAGSGWLRWAVTLVALVVLVVGAYRAYLWLVSDVARRRAAAEQTVEAPPADLAGAAQPMAPSSQEAGEPVAPAVVGGSVNRCLVNGRLIYTNTDCPAGSRPVATSTASADTSGAGAPLAATDVVDDPASQQQATCNFLTAETARLDYESRQPLPPPVLQDIATHLVGLRQQAAAAYCAPPPKPAAAPAPVGRVRRR